MGEYVPGDGEPLTQLGKSSFEKGLTWSVLNMEFCESVE